MSKFCKSQIVCKEDRQNTEETYTCTAHLHEARAMQCPYKSFKDSQERIYRCVDAEEAENERI